MFKHFALGLRLLAAGLAASAALAGPAAAQQSSSDQDFAKQLANPVAALISVPFQYNYLRGFRPNDGYVSEVNIQPVIPFSISADWNIISRTILPVIYAKDIGFETGSEFGLGNTTQSFFLSPKKPTAQGLIWGVGPVISIPTRTDERLGPKQWGAGVTAVGLLQKGHWTTGLLWNHIWSLDDDEEYGRRDATLLQPFVSYVTPKATTFSLMSQSTYDWEDSQWTAPVIATVSQLVKIGDQRLQIGGGPMYFLASPDGGPRGWGARVQVTLLFPKKG